MVPTAVPSADRRVVRRVSSGSDAPVRRSRRLQTPQPCEFESHAGELAEIASDPRPITQPADTSLEDDLFELMCIATRA